MDKKFDNLHKLKDSEFADLIENTKFVEQEESKYDEDGDEKKAVNKTKLARYISTATGFIFTLSSPCILLLCIYYILRKYCFHKSRPGILIFLIVLGIFTGYWSLFKEIGGTKK